MTAAAYSRPEYWAMRVPAAIPSKPIPSKRKPPNVNPIARTMLTRTLPRLTMKSTIIGFTLSCIPMNQPLSAIRDNVAGAAHILIWKYLSASSLTSGEHLTKRKAKSTKTH